MADQSRLTWALILSVLLHGLVLSLMPFVRRAQIQIPAPPALLDVDVVPLPKPAARAAAPAQAVPALPALAIPIPKQQIVSPPDEGEEKPPENPRFLSDRDNTVKQETVHRAEPAAGDPDSKHAAPPRQMANAKTERQPPARAAEPPAPNRKTALPKIDQLLPPTGDLIREGLVQPQEPAPPAAPQQEASKERTDLLRHGDPWKTGALRGGTLDFLPAVREGDITLLNTKAEQFAPFVRRVAVRIFENFRMLLRRSMDRGRTDSVEEFATIEAVMDKQGRLVKIEAKDRSVSAALGTDRNLQSAVQEGFFDRNPPPGAEANDGYIHFVFDARVALMVDAGRGLVGYRALFQAGLL